MIFDVLKDQSNNFEIKANALLSVEEIDAYYENTQRFYKNIIKNGICEKTSQVANVARLLLRWLDPH